MRITIVSIDRAIFMGKYQLSPTLVTDVTESTNPHLPKLYVLQSTEGLSGLTDKTKP